MASSTFLGTWGRIYVAGIAIFVVLFAIFSVTCFLNKNGLGFLILNRERRKKKKGLFSEKDSILWSDVVYQKRNNLVYLTTSNTSVSESTGYPYEEKNAAEAQPLKKRDSAYSTMSENSTVSTEFLMGSITDCSFEGEVQEYEKSAEIENGPAEISFSIQYTPLSTKKEIGKLVLIVNEATKLPGRSYMGGACNPYVNIFISQQKSSIYKKSTTVKIFHTKTIRHTTNPKYDQKFVIDTSYNDLKNCAVKFVVMDEDKYGNSTPLGQIEQILKDVKDLLCTVNAASFKFYLKPPQYNSGELLFGLNYLPTAKRLAVSVLKADHLNYLEAVTDVSEFYSFVRILLLSPSGRIYRKKKTSVKGHTDKPVWNQALIFDLGPHKLENITFMIMICAMPPDTNGESLRSECQVKKISQGCKRQDKYLGKVVLGLRVSHEEERTHWQEIISSPRKMVSKWHILK